MTVGERVRFYRELRQMEQKDLASHAQIGRSAMNKIEHGTQRLTFDEAMRVAAVLDVRLEDLADTPVSISIPTIRADAVLQCVEEAQDALGKLKGTLRTLAGLSSTMS